MKKVINYKNQFQNQIFNESNEPFSKYELQEIKDDHLEIKIEDTERVSVPEVSLEGKNDADQDNTSIQRPSSDNKGTLGKEHILKTTAMISVEQDTPKKDDTL